MTFWSTVTNTSRSNLNNSSALMAQYHAMLLLFHNQAVGAPMLNLSNPS